MAEVKIIDIDGEQWNIKDQGARIKIETLNQKVDENTSVIETLSKNVQKGFVAHRLVTKVTMYSFETCFISGYVNNVGPYMAILSARNAAALDIINLYGSVSNYINVKTVGDFEYELSLDGPINIFGFAQSSS